MNRKGFTLIELMIVIAIIAIIAAIAIPGILAARRSANANAAMGNLKSFATAMTVYQQKSDAQTYPKADGTAPDFTGDKDNTYSHLDTKGGYRYQYYGNDTTAPTQYVYVAYPTSLNNGVKAFIVDESNSIWENTVTGVPTAAATLTVTFPADTYGPGRVAWPTTVTFSTGTWTKRS